MDHDMCAELIALLGDLDDMVAPDGVEDYSLFRIKLEEAEAVVYELIATTGDY